MKYLPLDVKQQLINQSKEILPKDLSLDKSNTVYDNIKVIKQVVYAQKFMIKGTIFLFLS